MKKLNFLKSGFSIMEVMIAAALLGAVSVGVMQLTKNMTKSSKTFGQRAEFANVTDQIKSLLRDEYSCEATLVGLNPTSGGSNVPIFKRRKPDGTTADVLTAGQAYGTGGTPIFLKKMEIKNYNTGSGIAEFWVTMNRGSKDYATMTTAEKDTVAATAYGSPVVPQILKVQVILDGTGKIKDCVSDKDDYTSGACGMIDGDWSDKVKCKSINISANATEPAITSEGYMAAKSGLTVGSGLATNPGDGSINIADKATVKNDTTITSGKLVFNDGDARINQVAGNNLYIENKAGSAGANLIVGKSGAARTTITSGSMVINKNGAITGTNKLEVAGDALISGNSKLTIGSGSIDYDGTDLNLNKPTGKKVNYKDGSTNEEVASQGFVNAQLGRALTGDSTTLTTILSNLGTLISGSPVQAIAATTCGFYSNMTWSSGRCVDNRTTNCTGNNMVYGFNNGAINCQPVVGTNQNCSGGQLFMGIDAAGTKICRDASTEIGTWVDNRIRASAAQTTCSAMGATWDGSNTCSWSESQTTGGTCYWTGCGGSCGSDSYFDYCHWSGGSPGCAGTCPSTCGLAWENHNGCRRPTIYQTRSCSCQLNTAGTSCGSNSCGSWH